MMRTSILGAFVALAAGWSAPPAAAAVLLVNGVGQLTGALNVEVAGSFYDVGFSVGTCIDVFSGCDDPSDIVFSTLDEAREAGNALLDQVFVDGPAGPFDIDPSRTAGCPDMTIGRCTAWVPYQIAFTMGFPVDVLVVLTENWVSNTSDFAFTSLSFPTNVPMPSANHVYAVFTPAQQPPSVSEPGTFVLVGSALAGLWTSRRRCRPARPRGTAHRVS